MDAPITVTFSCGHDGTIEVNTVDDDDYAVERKTEWAEQEGLCTECWKQQQFEEADAAAKARGLPPLRGTDKQIRWATQLRNTALDECGEIRHAGRYRVVRATAEDWDRWIGWLREQDDARYWIDHHGSDPRKGLVEDYVEWNAAAARAAAFMAKRAKIQGRS